MKFLHLADLHLGKRYNELSLIDDQRFILNRITEIAVNLHVDAVFIAGDIYDKSVPSAEAVELFDSFLNALTEADIKVYAISGNHDSAERIAFGAKQMSCGGVFVSPVYSGSIAPYIYRDEYGEVYIYLLPFIKPATVRSFFADIEIDSYNDAVAAAIAQMNAPEDKRCVLVAHQFVTGSLGSGSEEFTVGDVGNVDGEIFSGFDYVALGHIHGAQNVGSERVRYCGTPLKYSLSEAGDNKTVTVVELKEKGNITVNTVPLTPMRDVREIRGDYKLLTDRRFYGGTPVNDLIHAVLTDEDEVVDAFAKLRLIYPNLMSVRYDNKRTRADGDVLLENVPARSPYELFEALFRAQNNGGMSPEQQELVTRLIGDIWGEEQ